MSFVFPQKPQNRDGFKRPVSWLVGRDLIAGLKWIALYTAFKGKIDPRDWMKPRVHSFKEPAATLKYWRGRNEKSWKWKIANDTIWHDYAVNHPDFWKVGEGTDNEEFWFDYIADSGDGQMATYNVAYLCLSDLWADNSLASATNPSLPTSATNVEVSFEPTNNQGMLLPRGQFLFVGGDTAYHISDYSTLSERFQLPFRWAFTSIRRYLRSASRLHATIQPDGNIPLLDSKGKKLRWDIEPTRPIFAVPGNHDYYDVIDGFNRQFRRPAAPDHGPRLATPQLTLPGFERFQEASYVALHLPFGWWFLGLDTEVSELDLRQHTFFFNVKDPVTGQWPDKLIVATPEPTTVFRKCKPEDDKTIVAFNQLGLPRQFLDCQPAEQVEPTKIRLDLSGDVHHYARYYGPNTKNFPPPSRLHSDNYASVVSGGGGAFHHPTSTQVKTGAEEQTLYPSPDVSRDAVAPGVFDLRNIWHGGYVWLFGMIIAWIICFASIIPPTSKDAVDWFFMSLRLPYVPDDTIPWFGPLTFGGGYDPASYWPSTLLMILAFAPLLWAIIRFNRIIKELILVPIITGKKREMTSKEFSELSDDQTEINEETTAPDEFFDVGEKQEEPPKRLPVHYWDLLPILVATLLTLAFFIVGIWKYVVDVKGVGLHPFTCSLLVLYHLALATGLVVLSVQNSEWLTHRAKHVLGTKYDFLPLSIDVVVALLIALWGVWVFGYYPAAYVLSDVIFAVVTLGLLVALIGVGYSVAGKLQNRIGKILMGVAGLWHAVLQLTVPLLLVRLGDWRAILLAMLFVFIFSGVSIPWTPVRIPGLGVLLMRWKSSIARWALTLAWLLFGAALLVLPYFFHERSQISVIVTARPYFYSSYLPQSWLDGIAHFYSSNAHDPIWTIATILFISLATAVVLGFILSMAWLSWYFAVSLGFNGHNNEVGGAARVEEYKHIVRIRLRNKDLTAFVIAVDNVEVDGKDLKPKLIDVFQLRV